jgi:ribokinase
MSVVVVGSANVDEVLEVHEIPQPGETVLAESRSRFAGGKGMNQAVASVRSDAETVFVTAVGDDRNGDYLLGLLRDEGVRTLASRSSDPTGRATVIRDARGENAIVVVGGANRTLTALSDEARAAIAAADVLLTQLEIPLVAVAQSFAAATAGGTRVVLNAAPSLVLPRDILDQVDVLVVNEHEAAVVAGETSAMAGQREGNRLHRATRLLTQLLTMVPQAIITLGGDGALVGEVTAGGSEVTRLSAPIVSVVDTTAAGDTFCGVLAAQLERGASLTQATTVAVTAASLSVQMAGAVPSIPGSDQITAALSYLK